jgi:hypothetical protein
MNRGRVGFSKITLQRGEGPGAETIRERLIEPEADASRGRAPQRLVGVGFALQRSGVRIPNRRDFLVLRIARHFRDLRWQALAGSWVPRSVMFLLAAYNGRGGVMRAAFPEVC